MHKIKNRVPSWFDRFTVYYNCMNKNVTKIISPRVLCTSITNRVFGWFHCFRAFYNCMREIITKLISPRVLCTSVTNRVRSWFDRFTAFYNCMSKNVTKLISPRICAQLSQIVFVPDLTVLRLIRTVWTIKITILKSPRVLCTSIRNLVLSWFDRFTAYYYFMRRNVKRLISPRVLCTSITDRVSSWFDRFLAY